MSTRPSIGDRVVHEVTVTPEMTARLFDREIHPVYGTAWMVRHVEEAGRLLVEPHLGPDEDATGYRIEMSHRKAARVGDRLRVVAQVIEVDRRGCTAHVEVWGVQGMVGRGVFVQRYLARGSLGGAATGGDPAAPGREAGERT